MNDQQPKPRPLKIGDVIRTARPMNVINAGSYLHAELSTPEAVTYGQRLIDSGRWVLCEKGERDGDP